LKTAIQVALNERRCVMPAALRMPLTLALAFAVRAIPAVAQVPPLGPDSLVGTPEHHRGPSVAINPYGQFLIGWVENFGGGTIVSYDRDGSLQGVQAGVGALVFSDSPIHVAPGSGDGFLAAWESWDLGLAAVRLDRFAGMVGSPFVVASGTAVEPRAAMTGAGDIVVVWTDDTSDGDDTSGISIQARRYLPSGLPAGDDFQVNTYTTGPQVRPAGGIMDGGAFEIIWLSDGSSGDPDHWSIQRRAFASDGTPIGAQEEFNTTIIGAGERPSEMSMNRNGDFVAAWDAWAFEVRARIYRNTLFVDGLESGGLSAWSAAEP
jgi:hypothetical protein